MMFHRQAGRISVVGRSTLQSHMRSGARNAWWAAVLLVTAYGALLRLDAYTSRYGPMSRPAWARIVTHDIAPLAARVKPHTLAWPPVSVPYVGGDPISYLKYAREMITFYQPHVREPVFLAATRAGLFALGGQDAGVSLASAAGSLLAILATYLLIATAVSPLAGVAAAAVIALDSDMISWASEGWRDDTFTAMVALTAWAFLRFHRQPVFRNAVLLGIMSGLACLARITALSFVLPALAWVALARGASSWRPRLEYAATATVLLIAVLGPYLLSCGIATGDPFYAINAHTRYYRAAEGRPFEQSQSAGAYIREKLVTHPFSTLDVGVTGEFVRPFTTKWTGLSVWSGVMATLLRWAALAGLLALPFTQAGRLLLIVLFGSLLPYAFTWNVGDGGAWRFTMHAYPLYVAAAMMAVHGVYCAVRYLIRRPPAWHAATRAVAVHAAAICLIVAGATLVYFRLPWYVLREAVARRESVSLETGVRDVSFFRGGWSSPHTEGLATVRVSREEKASIYFPLPEPAPCDVVLRVDPVAPPAWQSMTVLFNSQVVLRTPLDWNPQRVGAYRVHLPVEWMKRGTNQLTLVTEPLIAAGSAGPKFRWLDPADRIGVRLWYVRVVPLAPPS